MTIKRKYLPTNSNCDTIDIKWPNRQTVLIYLIILISGKLCINKTIALDLVRPVEFYSLFNFLSFFSFLMFRFIV